MGKGKRATANRLLHFADILGDRHLITVSAGPDLEPVILSLGQAPDYRTSTDGSFPKRRAANPNCFRIHYPAGAEWLTLDLSATTENYHAVQPLPDGRWLLVRGRSGGASDRNARVYEATGAPGPAFHAGDGIADVQATEKGRIWVSYFDEGVFGNTPLGQSGLVRLEPNGRPSFRLGDLPDAVLRSMADCYALNVCSDQETWLYFYTDFPLVRLVDGRVSGHWRVPVEGRTGSPWPMTGCFSAAATTGRSPCSWGSRAGTAFAELTPVDERGKPLRRFRTFGRRHLLFLATEEALHSVDHEQLVKGPPSPGKCERPKGSPLAFWEQFRVTRSRARSGATTRQQPDVPPT